MKCPICGKETIQQYKPFCSKRCADVDLSRWLNGGYVIHTDETPDTMQGE
ncbi:MAG: DNA gyrase inhibitor YacG [Alphaproteobacteria bacterium]|nr:DNA gyrase inhibitor YacG [Alphaproteobacteria bacterium]